MQDHLKERITGAAILVVVVVLLVPEMFRGPPPARLKSGSGAAAGPPVRSYTIDLRDSAGTGAPAAGSPEIATPAPAAETAPAAGPLSAPAVATAPAPARAANPAPAAAAPAAAAPAAAATGAQGGTVKSGWTVQVGSFARRDYAERMVKQVAAKGFTVEVAGPDDRGLYRVRSAPQSHAAALALKQKMQASGLKPIINTTP